MTTGIGNHGADLTSCQGLFVLFALFLIETSNLPFQDHVYELLNTIDACQCFLDIVSAYGLLCSSQIVP